MDMITLPAGDRVPSLGLGTWHMGARTNNRAAEVRALQHGVDLGMILIDTAEMYADGGAEEVTGAAIAGRRDAVFVVSKVLPHNASRSGTVAACEASLRRLGIETLDLYLLHWPGHHPLEETLGGFEALRAAGKIRHYGVSNFDPADMADLTAAGATACQTNQCLYNPSRRGIEFDLLPMMAQAGMPLMAYSPLEQGRLADDPVLTEIGRGHGVDALAVALAWVLRRGDVIAIPKASDLAHVAANRAAAGLVLGDDELALIDAAFPPPERAAPLEIL
ncbi:MAG: aldo/keto reductase [Pseudomonadota bacterium]|nr:aldo/keto reductase [Pseudomonadota bacterium]